MYTLHSRIIQEIRLGDGDIGYLCGHSGDMKTLFVAHLDKPHKPRSKIKQDGEPNGTAILILKFKSDADIDFLIKELNLLKNFKKDNGGDGGGI